MQRQPRGAMSLDLLGMLLVCALVVLYCREGFAVLWSLEQQAAAQRQAVAVDFGDVALRDVPKALAVAQGRWNDDPHYIGEVHWYPFMGPLLVAGYQALTGAPLQMAYLSTTLLISGASLLALAALLRVYVGPLAWLVMPICLAGGLLWPYNSVYPSDTVRPPLMLFLAAAGCAASAIYTSHRRSAGWFALAGALNGLLGLWHGASFVTATVVGALLVGAAVVRGLISPATTGPTARFVAVRRGGYYLAGFTLLVAPLLGQQVLHYGALRQSDAARLFLNPLYYTSGDDLHALLTLALLPWQRDAIVVALFVAAIVSVRERALRWKLMPLLAAYLWALLLAHLGFVMHSVNWPTLATISRLLLVAPPHTFKELSDTLLGLIKVALIGLVIVRLVVWLGAGWQRRVQHGEAMRRLVPLLAGAVALLIAYGALLATWRPHDHPYIRNVDRDLFTLLERTAALTGGQQAVLVEPWHGQDELVQTFPFKVLFLHSPFHQNPYVAQQRMAAETELLALDEQRAMTLTAQLERYQLRYVLTLPKHTSPLVGLCGGEQVLQSPQGYQLVRLGTRCRVPQVAAAVDIAPEDRLGLQVDQEVPMRIVGLKSAKGENFVEYASLPVVPGAAGVLVVTGTLAGPPPAGPCLRSHAIFVRKNKRLSETQRDLAAAGTFVVRTLFVAPQQATGVVIHLSFTPACFAEGRRVILRSVAVAPELPGTGAVQ